MSSLFLCSVFIFKLTIIFTWAAQSFVEVSDCPKDANEWDMRSKKKNCLSDGLDYLCAAIENKLGRYGEICTNQRWIPENECVILNAQTHNLDSVDCKADTGCPKDLYLPSDLWQYKICFENFYGITTSTLAHKTTPTITIADARNGSLIEDGSEDDGSGAEAGVAVGVVIVLMFVIIVVGILVVFYVRNQFGFRDKLQQLYTDLRKYFQHGDENSAIAENGEAQSTQVPLLKQDVKHVQENETNSDKNDEPPGKKIEKLEELLKYLVHILKQELGVNDLKEKVVIHSKSINRHFSEPLIKDLQSLKDINDYSRLDTSLVFTLLRNFCEGINPPSRGWGYEPPDDETHVGADIERIRSMWNRYSDNAFVCKHLDDVYNRIKLKYETVAVHGDDGIMKSSSKDEENTETILGNDGVSKSPSKDRENTEGSELMKDKINSIKLNPDCTVEKGIVITENITTALKILKTKNVVILKGVIGCGKTHALKAIQNHFKDKNLETAWVEPENILKKISESKEKSTMLLCDNLFGRFGSSVFSQDAVNQMEEVLKEIERSEWTTKVVIGIHTHVYEEVKKTFKLNFLHQKNITVEMDNLSEAETLLIFKEQLTKGHCKMDPNCWFKNVGFQSVLDKLSKNQGHIGGPFLSLMYCNQHELFSDEAFSVNPIQTLVQHIQKMTDNSPKLYDCLVYLMCVQQHNLEEEPETWAGHISADITKHNLMDLAKTSCLLHVDNKIATLAHDLLTTVLFKCAAEKTEIFFPVLQICKKEVFLQLLRPTGSTCSDLYFEYLPDLKNRDVGRMCTYRLARMYRNQEINHPLMTVELVNHKSVKYLTHDPKGLTVINVSYE